MNLIAKRGVWGFGITTIVAVVGAVMQNHFGITSPIAYFWLGVATTALAIASVPKH